MNKSLLPMVLGLVAILTSLPADDIALSDGTILKNAKIVQKDDAQKTVTIIFSGGTALVQSEMVPAKPVAAQQPATQNAVNSSPPASELSAPAAPPNTPIPKEWTVDGRDYHNVNVTQVEPDRVHITYDGGIGTLMIADLTPDLKKRFNYDPVAAKTTADERSQKEAQSDAMVAAQMRQQAKDNAAQAAQQQTHKTTTMMGSVLQKIPGGGLLVSCGITGIPEGSGVSVDSEDDQLPFMLKGMPNEADIVDSTPIHEIVYRSGTYSYTTTAGVLKTIPAYTAVGPYHETGPYHPHTVSSLQSIGG